MSIFASILRSVYKLSGAKKAFALPGRMHLRCPIFGHGPRAEVQDWIQDSACYSHLTAHMSLIARISVRPP